MAMRLGRVTRIPKLAITSEKSAGVMKPLFDLSTLRNAAVRLVQRSSSFCLSRLWAVFADRGGMAGDDRHNPRRAGATQLLPRDSMTPRTEERDD